jgi:hypothetical protein
LPATAEPIVFSALLLRAEGLSSDEQWLFLRLPQEASSLLPSRGLNSVEGTFGGVPFWTTLQPDGEGGHWMRVEQSLLHASGLKKGDTVYVETATMAEEPEPLVPHDLREALDAAVSLARETWDAITPVARRDWIHWIVSGRKAETRTKRISVAISKLSAGSRRPCCFDRSGMYDRSLRCPTPEPLLDNPTD